MTTQELINKRHIVTTLAALVVLAGCAQRDVEEREDTIFTKQDETQSLEGRILANHEDLRLDITDRLVNERYRAPQEEMVVSGQYPYVSTTPAALGTRGDLPPVFRVEVEYAPSSNRTLEQIVRDLAVSTALNFHVRDDVYQTSDEDGANDDDEGSSQDRDVGKTVLAGGTSYDGDFAGLLNVVTSALNISWEYDADEETVVLSRYVSRSYRLATATTMFDDTGASRTVGAWTDTIEALEGFVSDEGRVDFSQSTGLITVTDTTDVHRQVETYISRANQSLRNHVTYDVEIMRVRMTEATYAGLDLSLGFQESGVQGSFQNSGSNVAGASNLVMGVVSGDSRFSGTEVAFNRLSELGVVDRITRRLIRAMNNEESSLREGETVSYISNIGEVSIGDDVGTTVQQSTVETGLDIRLVPHVSQDGARVLTNTHINLSELLDLQAVTTGDSTIFSPTTSDREVSNVPFMAEDGDAIVIAAFEDLDQNSRERGLGFGQRLWWLGGSRSQDLTREMTVIVMRPQIHHVNL